MKRKFITINILVSFLSLSIFVFLLSFIIKDFYNRSIEHEITGYLNVILEVYEDDEKSSADILLKADDKIRITFIDKSGKVIYDTKKISHDNHLNRPEIEELGKIVYRDSDTILKECVYIAGMKNNTYIRISIEKKSIFTFFSSLFLGAAIILIVILVLSIIFDNYYYKKMMKPLQKEIAKLGQIVGNDSDGLDDIHQLSTRIDKVHSLIDEKIESLETEKNKLNYIIEHMNQGLIIISGDGKVLISNKYALNLLEYYNDDYIGKNYVYLLHNFNITDVIDKAFITPFNENKIIKQNEKYYSVSIISLEGSFASVDKKNGIAIFILDISEQKRIEQIKTDFFQNASHELKSPLTTILGYQQMIQAGIISDEDEIKKATENTIKEAKRINNIVIEMLELFKLESKLSSFKETLSISNCIESLTNSVIPQLEQRNISFRFEGENFNVLMNKEDLTRLLRNIIDNAIKYNKDNGFLTISLRANLCIIKDGGIGIPKIYQDRIFERFFRVDKARSRAIGGTGLGLAIVKHICLNYGIFISVESEEGLGTTFTLDFKNVII